MSEKLLSDAMESIGLVPENVYSQLGSVLEWAKKAAIELGCERKDDVIAAADKVIDYLVSLDIPNVPAVIEVFIDNKMSAAAKAWVREEVAKLCA